MLLSSFHVIFFLFLSSPFLQFPSLYCVSLSFAVITSNCVWIECSCHSYNIYFPLKINSLTIYLEYVIICCSVHHDSFSNLVNYTVYNFISDLIIVVIILFSVRFC